MNALYGVTTVNALYGVATVNALYAVAAVSSIDKTIGLFRRILSLL